MILEIDWFNDEWMELIEVVRRKCIEVGCVNVFYVNLLFFYEWFVVFFMDYILVVGLSCLNLNGDMSRRVGMFFYENLKKDIFRIIMLLY